MPEDAGRAATEPSTMHAAARGRELVDRAAAIAARLDFESVAQQIVDAVVEVTDFRVATITVREGVRCRRLATAGLADGRIGMTTPLEHWSVLLNEEWRVGSASYLVPPEAPARWADVPDLAPSDIPNAWTADHGLVLPLKDPAGEIIGFVAVDEPRSGLLPDEPTIERLEAFAREAQAAFVNAHLYAAARRQADAMEQLFEVAKAMATTADLQQVMPPILHAMNKRFEAVRVVVGRLLDDHFDMRLMGRLPDGGIETAQTQLAGPLQLMGEELRVNRTLVVNDLHDRPDLQPFLVPEARALLAAGAVDEDERVVALAVLSDRAGAFDAQDEAFLRGLLDITIVAMRNADLYEEVRAAAERDALTGLRNRRVFWTLVESTLARATQDQPVCLAVVDIDDFKQLNDAHGHDAGDRALIHVAMRLEAGARETDAVFRIGGDEFVVVLPGANAEGAAVALERIRGSIGRTRLDLPEVSVSVGLAVAASPDVTGDDLFAQADAALFRAKRAGKSRIEMAG